MRRRIAIFLLLFISFSGAFGKHSPKAEIIWGQIVAYSDTPLCLNRNTYWHMLIRVEGHENSSSAKFIDVHFSSPCKKFPEWLNHKSSVQKFRVIREQPAETMVQKYRDCSDSANVNCPQLPIWKPIPGAEDEKLPFGHLVPSYRSLDLPLVPLV